MTKTLRVGGGNAEASLTTFKHIIREIISEIRRIWEFYLSTVMWLD